MLSRVCFNERSVIFEKIEISIERGARAGTAETHLSSARERCLCLNIVNAEVTAVVPQLAH